MKSPIYDDSGIDEHSTSHPMITKPEGVNTNPNIEHPEFKLRLSKIKDEVTKYLHQHLSMKQVCTPDVVVEGSTPSSRDLTMLSSPRARFKKADNSSRLSKYIPKTSPR